MARLLLLLFLLFTMVANGQTDTTKSGAPESWKKPVLGIRAGLGIQNHFYTELGVSLQQFYFEERHGVAGYSYYATFEWTPASPGKEQVYGVKAGAELFNNGATGALELKYLFNSLSNDVVFTPKFGLGIMLATLYYGYNFSTHKYPFPNIRKHQFSLAFNSSWIHYERRSKKKRIHE